jgi:peptidase YpeB-like protein
MRSAFATAALFVLLFAASPAAAQPYFVSSGDAQAIAAQNGVVAINRLRLDDGVWKVEGRDVTGRYVYMRIDPRTGDVLRLERGWF